MSPIWIIVGLFLGLTFLFLFLRRNIQRKEEVHADFPLPTPTIDPTRQEAFHDTLQQSGFRKIDEIDKLEYGFWPSPTQLFAHDQFPAFGECSVLPTGEFQIQFVSVFPGGSVTTIMGEKLLTMRPVSPSDLVLWEKLPFKETWETHMRFAYQHSRDTTKSALTPTREAYYDYLTVSRQNIQKQLDQLTPSTFYDFIFLGYLYLDKGEKKRAFEMFQKGGTLNPNSAAVNTMIGKIALFISYYEKALPYFLKSLELVPEEKLSYTLLAETYQCLRKTRQAFSVLQEALEVFPDDPELLLKLGILATRLGELEQAKYYLGEIDSIAHPSIPLFKALAELYRKTGEPQKAKVYERLIRVFEKQKNMWKGSLGGE